MIREQLRNLKSGPSLLNLGKVVLHKEECGPIFSNLSLSLTTKAIPMSLLCLVAATLPETEPLRSALEWMQIAPGHFQTHAWGYDLELIHTGIGMVNTAWSLAAWSSKKTRFDLGINLGIAGAYDPDLALGQVVEIIEDSFAEMGADSPEGFLSLDELGFPLLTTSTGPSYNTLRNPEPFGQGLTQVWGLTVNQVQGTAAGIQQMRSRWGAEVESMEGAAFFYAMLRIGKPFAAFRAVSNYVEPRDRSRWKIGLAVKEVNEYLLQTLSEKRW